MNARVKRQNELLTSFLYGLQASEQLPDLAAYDPGRVLIPYVAAHAIYAVTEHMSLFGNTGLTFYPDKVLNSPIVNQRTSFNLVGGLAFTFKFPGKIQSQMYMKNGCSVT